MTLYNVILHVGTWDSYEKIQCGSFETLEQAKKIAIQIEEQRTKVITEAPYTYSQVWDEIYDESLQDRHRIQNEYLYSNPYNKIYYDSNKITITEKELNEFKIYRFDANVVFEQKLN